MFKFKYNVILFIQIFLNLINSFLTIKIFGISAQTDSFFMLQTIFSAIYLIQYMPIEQFMYFYNDAKVESKNDAEKFYNFSIIFSLFVGILFFIFFSIFDDYIVKIFAYKLDSERTYLLNYYISVYKWILIFIPFNFIISSLLIAEMYIGYQYILNIIPVIFILITQLFCWKYQYRDISILIKATLFGSLLSCVLNIIIVKIKIKYRFYFVFSHNLARRYIINSLSIRLGHNIHNFLFPLVTNNFISAFPVGLASCFSYAQKIISIIQNIITGPSTKILQSKISLFWSSSNLDLIKKDIKKYFKILSLLALLALIITYFSIPYVFKILSLSEISLKYIYLIREMFLGLAIWNFILFLEAPFDMILVSSKNSRIFIIVNSVFIFSYSIILLSLSSIFGIYSIIIALIVAQGINFFFYSKYALKLLNLNHRDVIKKILNYLNSKINYYNEV